MSYLEVLIQVLWVIGFCLTVIAQLALWFVVYFLSMALLVLTGVLLLEIVSVKTNSVLGIAVSAVYGVLAVALYVWMVNNFSVIDLYATFYS